MVGKENKGLSFFFFESKADRFAEGLLGVIFLGIPQVCSYRYKGNLIAVKILHTV